MAKNQDNIGRVLFIAFILLLMAIAVGYRTGGTQ